MGFAGVFEGCNGESDRWNGDERDRGGMKGDVFLGKSVT
jgi:hypothetical protein